MLRVIIEGRAVIAGVRERKREREKRGKTRRRRRGEGNAKGREREREREGKRYREAGKESGGRGATGAGGRRVEARYGMRSIRGR